MLFYQKNKFIPRNRRPCLNPFFRYWGGGTYFFFPWAEGNFSGYSGGEKGIYFLEPRKKMEIDVSENLPRGV